MAKLLHACNQRNQPMSIGNLIIVVLVSQNPANAFTVVIITDVSTMILWLSTEYTLKQSTTKATTRNKGEIHCSKAQFNYIRSCRACLVQTPTAFPEGDKNP